MHYPQPKMNQKSPKDPKSIFILTMKLLYTYFLKRLPTGALIWLTPIWLISPNRATHLKSPKNDRNVPKDRSVSRPLQTLNLSQRTTPPPSPRLPFSHEVSSCLIRIRITILLTTEGFINVGRVATFELQAVKKKRKHFQPLSDCSKKECCALNTTVTPRALSTSTQAGAKTT